MECTMASMTNLPAVLLFGNRSNSPAAGQPCCRMDSDIDRKVAPQDQYLNSHPSYIISYLCTPTCRCCCCRRLQRLQLEVMEWWRQKQLWLKVLEGPIASDEWVQQEGIAQQLQQLAAGLVALACRLQLEAQSCGLEDILLDMAYFFISGVQQLPSMQHLLRHGPPLIETQPWLDSAALKGWLLARFGNQVCLTIQHYQAGRATEDTLLDMNMLNILVQLLDVMLLPSLTVADVYSARLLQLLYHLAGASFPAGGGSSSGSTSTGTSTNTGTGMGRGTGTISTSASCRQSKSGGSMHQELKARMSVLYASTCAILEHAAAYNQLGWQQQQQQQESAATAGEEQARQQRQQQQQEGQAWRDVQARAQQLWLVLAPVVEELARKCKVSWHGLLVWLSSCLGLLGMELVAFDLHWCW